MSTSILASRAGSLNAKVGALALAAAAFATLLLSHFAAPLSALRLLALALAAFAAWAFCDEMGLRKPLNRAGFVSFAIGLVAKIHIVVGLDAQLAGRFHLLYAMCLLLAVLFWSVAFLHRQRALKAAGTVGLIASAIPIAAMVAGHVAVGAGAALGVSELLSAAEGRTSADLTFVTWVERIFGLWAYAAAWLLWRGYIKPAA